MKIPVYQVDAFTAQTFGGNPAAVCPLEGWIEPATMQSIAGENNLSETAFLVKTNGGYDIRWFTPAVEIDLCGHATLASAHVIFRHLEPGRNKVEFSSKSGKLTVSTRGDLLVLDFPSRPAAPCEAPPALAQALGAQPKSVLKSRDYLAVFEDEAAVRALAPNFKALSALDHIIVTAPGNDVDYVYRFFAPQAGIDEDPATGSAQCTLVPYWTDRLGKKSLRSVQLSRRGAQFVCNLRGDRVDIGGSVSPFMRGTIEL